MAKEFDPMEIILMQKLIQKPSKKWIVGLILLVIIGLVALYFFYSPFRELIDTVNPFIDKVWLVATVTNHGLNDAFTVVCEEQGCVTPTVTKYECDAIYHFKVKVTKPDRSIYNLEEKDPKIRCHKDSLAGCTIEHTYDCSGYTQWVVPITQEGDWIFEVELIYWNKILSPVIGWQWVGSKTIYYTAT